MYRRNHRKCRSSHRKCSEKKDVLKKFNKLHRKIPVLESLFNTVAGLQPASFLKRDSNMCFPVKSTKVLRTSILKNISERLLLEMFYKKAVLKNFAIFTGRKELAICVMWKRYSWWLTELWKWRVFTMISISSESSWLNELFFP